MKYWLFSTLLLMDPMSAISQKPGNVKALAFRLTPHQDVKKSLMEFAVQHQLKAACIVTAVGSLEQIHLRYANQQNGTLRKGFFEVVSLTGTFSSESAHLHISVSDSLGVTIGGHLLDDNLVYTTLEVVIMELTDVAFSREKDSSYGYPELLIKPRTINKK